MDSTANTNDRNTPSETQVVTAPTAAMQFLPVPRLLGERRSNGSLTPLKVCGYLFRYEDILDWMDSRKMMMKYAHRPTEREDMGWGYIMNTLGPYCGVQTWMVRAPFFDEQGKRMGSCEEKCLVVGTNRTQSERAGTRNLKRLERIHKVLEYPMGKLGPPRWYIPIE